MSTQLRLPEDLVAIHEEYRATRRTELRDQLVSRHLGIARRIAHGFNHRGELFDDLLQVALIGLTKSIERFDPDRGVQFSTFAGVTITGELKRHFRDKAWAIRTPRAVQERYLAMKEAREYLTHEFGRSPTLSEVAEFVGVTDDEIVEAIDAGSNLRTMSIEIGAAGAEDERRQLGMEDARFEEVEHHHTVEALLARLPEREQSIVRLRFLEGMTQAQVGERVGLSQMHVSRVLARALERMRHLAAGLDG